MRVLLVLAALLVEGACRGDAPPPAPSPVTGAAGSDAAVGDPTALRFDRPPARVGGPQTWAYASEPVALAYCPGDRELVTIDTRARVRRFTVATGEQLSSVALGEPPLASGHPLVCGEGDVVKTLDPQRRTTRIDRWGTITRDQVSAPAETRRTDIIGTTDDFIATTRGASLLIQRRRDGLRREIRESCEAAWRATPLAISHDGKQVAIACKQPAGIRIYELDSGVQTSDDVAGYGASRLAWSPDRTLLAIRPPGGSIATWDGAKLATKPASSGHSVWWQSSTDVAFDTARGILAWPPPDGPVRSLDATPHVRAASDGERAMILVDERGTLTALVGGVAREIALPSSIRGLAAARVELAPSGTRALVTGLEMIDPRPASAIDVPDPTSVELDLQTGSARTIATPHTAAILGERSPPMGGNRSILLGTRDGTIVRESDGAIVGQHNNKVTALAETGGLVAAGGADGVISIWRDGKELGRLVGHDGHVIALAFSGDGRLASSGDDTTLVWDLRP